MKWKRWVSGLALSAALLALPAQAMDYNFTTAAPQDFYTSGSYEDVYGSQYNYGGRWWTTRFPSWSTACSAPPRRA